MERFNVSIIDRQYLMFSHPQRGDLTVNLYNMNYTCNDIVKYFKSFGVAKYGSQSYRLLDWCDFDSPKTEKILDLIISKRPRYQNLSNLGNIIKNMRWGEEEEMGIKTMFDLLDSDLNYYFRDLRDDFNGGFKRYKINFRKDIRRILVENKIEITRSLCEVYGRENKILNDVILILHNEKLMNYFHPNEFSDKIIYIISDLKALITLGGENKKGYELKSILLKVFNYYTIYENLGVKDAVNYLKDYASMYEQMGVFDYVRYPKFLKSNHDIIEGEFRRWEQKVDEPKFKEMVDITLEAKAKNYYFIVPKISQEIKDEGKALSHCVGSYIKRVVEGKTKILFMRVDPNVSLATLEIRDQTIIQARGYGNRNLSSIEKNVLEEYARMKNMIVRI